MDFLVGMNEAIKYIEEHLTDTIDTNEVAKLTGYSYAYFQRVFSCISGVTVAEYVRKKKE